MVLLGWVLIISYSLGAGWDMYVLERHLGSRTLRYDVKSQALHVGPAARVLSLSTTLQLLQALQVDNTLLRGFADSPVGEGKSDLRQGCLQIL